MIAQKQAFFHKREQHFNFVKSILFISVLLLSNLIHAQTPSAPAPPGKKWQTVANLSDEFNASFDGNKWFKPLWNYPEPNFMVNQNSGVSGGNLWIKATRGSGNRWFVSSRVQSRAQIKYPMYTECRMRASSISALNTFWMNNGDANNRDEIDICENNAAPTGNPSNGAETPFINASNWWYAENGTNYDGNNRGQIANNHNSTKNLSPSNPLRGVKLDADYHIIGCYWINEKSFEWWLDGEKVGETSLNIPQVFTRNQNIIWDLWTNPHDGFPARSDLQNNRINTMYVDWIHTYKLVNAPGNPGTPRPSNLAAGKRAFQSSTFQNNTSSFGPGRVVDGNGNTFNATKNQKGSWWEVDLGASYTINRVRIWNRGDCCSERLKDFDIKIYNRRGGNVVKSIYVSGQPSINGSNYNINAKGRVVRVQLRGSNILSMDQISVFGSANTNNGGPMTIQAENFTTTGGTFNDSSFGGPGIGVRKAKNFISFINPGDYVDYRVTIPRSGFYKITYKIASPNANSTITFGIPNQDFHTTAVPNTGGWNNYRSLESSKVENFSAGTHIVRLKANGSGRWTWNLDEFTMKFENASKNFDSNISDTKGTSDTTNEKVYIYPIPAQSNITIKGTSDGEKEVSVFNMYGSVVMKTKVTIVGKEANLDISSLSSGMYILSINGKTLNLVVN